MRIIHDVEDEMQVATGGHALGSSPGMYGYNGCTVDITACNDEEQIHIHGKAEHVKAMLYAMLEQIEMHEESFMRDLGRQQRKALCPNCIKDAYQPNVLHLVSCPQHVNYALFQPGGEYYKEPK